MTVRSHKLHLVLITYRYLLIVCAMLAVAVVMLPVLVTWRVDSQLSEAARNVEVVGGTLLIAPPPDRWYLAAVRQIIGLEEPGIARAYGVNLVACDFDDEWLSFLSNLPSLEEIRLSDSPVSDDGVTYLSILSELRELYLDGTNVSDNCFEVLNKIPNLETLDLSRTKVTGDSIETLLESASLMTLGLDDITPLHLDTVVSILEANRIQTLFLRNSGLSDDHFLGLSKCGRIRSLHIDNSVISSVGLSRLSAAECELRFLSITDIPLGLASFQVLIDMNVDEIQLTWRGGSSEVESAFTELVGKKDVYWVDAEYLKGP